MKRVVGLYTVALVVLSGCAAPVCCVAPVRETQAVPAQGSDASASVASDKTLQESTEWQRCSAEIKQVLLAGIDAQDGYAHCFKGATPHPNGQYVVFFTDTKNGVGYRIADIRQNILVEETGYRGWTSEFYYEERLVPGVVKDLNKDGVLDIAFVGDNGRSPMLFIKSFSAQSQRMYSVEGYICDETFHFGSDSLPKIKDGAIITTIRIMNPEGEDEYKTRKWTLREGRFHAEDADC